MKLIRGFATVGAMTIVSRVLGFVRDVLMAALLGTSYVVGLAALYRRVKADRAEVRA